MYHSTPRTILVRSSAIDFLYFPESNKIQSVVWTLEPAPQIFIDVVCFVKSGFVRFIGMPKLRVQKSLSKITRALKSYVEAVEAH